VDPQTTVQPSPAPDATAGQVDHDAREHPDPVSLSETLANRLFLAACVLTVPLVILVFGRDQWFQADEWFVLARPDGFPQVFEPNAGTHWVMWPRLLYAALWPVVGMHSYWPYQVPNVVLHVVAVAMLRVVMRRSGVGPWLATAAATPMLLFGAGPQAIIFGFQVGFTGSLAWSMVQLVAADHDDPSRRRLVLALAAGLLAVTSSGVGVVTTVMVGLGLFLRWGWRRAAFQAVPPVVLYGVWAAVQQVQSTVDRKPTVDQIIRWVRVSVASTFTAISHFEVLGWLLAVLIIVGLVLAFGPGRDMSWADLRHQWAIPAAMFVTIFLFSVNTALGRFYEGDTGAQTGRYLYLQAFLLLPLVARCAQEISRRWPVTTPVLAMVLLLPVPFNLKGFDSDFLRTYAAQRSYVLTTAVRMPFARDVPRSVHPVPDKYDGPGLNIGFLLDAQRAGRLEPSTIPLTPMVVNEFRLRLGFSESHGVTLEDLATCEKLLEPTVITPAVGDELAFTGPFVASTVDEAGDRSSAHVWFVPADNGSLFTTFLPDLRIEVKPATADRVSICTVK